MATYYVTQTAQGNGSGSSYANSMSVSSHNSATFAGDDIIYLCGTITSSVSPPTSGTSGHLISYISDPEHPCTIDGNYATATGFGKTGTIYLSVEGLTITRCTGEGIRARAAGSSSTDDLYTTISDCVIHDIGVDGTSGNGIDGRGIYLTVTGCTIYNTIFDGIYHAGANASISYCNIHDVDKTTGTAGGDCIQLSSATNAHVFNNTLDHSSKSSKNCLIINDSSATGVVINNNIVTMATYDAAVSAGVWSSAPGALIYNNIVYSGNTGIYTATGTGISICYNILVSNYTGINASDASQYVYNNTVYNSGYRGIIVGEASSDSKIYNNIVYNCVTGIAKNGVVLEDYNTVYGCTTARSNLAGDESWGDHPVDADPKFRSPSDFHLRSSSPCINAGTTIEGLTTDLDGRRVPYSVAPDIGAYEYRPTVGPFRW